MSGAIDKTECLNALLSISKPLVTLEAELAQLPWDGAAAVVLSPEHIKGVLQGYLSGAIDARAVETWANLVEGREDIAMQPSVRQVIYRLANPILEGELSEKSAQNLMDGLLSS